MTADERYGPLRRALAREYRIDAVLEESPRGAAYVAHELALERRVLIRAIDPALAGAAATEAFQRRARMLAAFDHHGLPAVHHAAPCEGCLVVVQEYVGLETLATALAAGPLAPPEVVTLGDLLLGALDRLHRAGLAHRAVAAEHVTAAPGRYVLDGFERSGLAAAEDVAADLHAAARLIATAAGEDGARSLPPAARAALGRALGPDTSRRWRSAAEFRAAFLRKPPRARSWRRVGVAAGIVAAVPIGFRIWRSWCRDCDAPPARELAIVPFEVDGGTALDPVASDFVPLLSVNLADVPAIRLTPPRVVDRWWERQGGTALGVDWRRAASDLRAHWVAHGLVDRRPDDVLRVRLTLHDSLGAPHVLAPMQAPAGDLAGLGDSVTRAIVRLVAPRTDSLYEPVPGLGTVPLPALRAFLQGEAAFARDAWALAQSFYEAAIRHDSTFAMAEWRLANVKRWRRLPYEGDLQDVYARHAHRFRLRERLLLEALIEPDLELRMIKLEEAIRRFPLDGYARLLQGEELFHRGPLTGRGVAESRPVFEAAAALDPLALAYDHLVLIAVRFGDRGEAAAALARRRAVGNPPHPDDLDLLPFLELVHDERFRPVRAWSRRRVITLRKDPRTLQGIERVARMGTPWLDMPWTQLRYSELLLRSAPRSTATYATAYEGKGLALYALGRASSALAHLDSAATLHDRPEARLQQAEWRVIPAALGLPILHGGEWTQRLEELASDAEVGARAAWALGLAAQSAGDTAAARRWTARLEPGTPLRGVLDARSAALAGDFALALARADSIRRAFQAPRPPDAFAGAAFHLFRGDWYAAVGDGARAEREWLWYEASDVEGWLTGLAQAGEVDAVLGVFARLKRARALLAAGTLADTVRACAHARRVAEIWADADSAWRPLAREAGALAARCRR